MENNEEKTEALIIFGQNIRQTREKRKLNISELAARSQYDRNCLSQLEYGEYNVSYQTALKLAKELNISFPALFSRNYLPTESDIFCEDDFLMVFIENIKRQLKAKGMSQARIYIESGIQESVVSRVLNRKINNPTINTLWKIARSITDDDMSRLFLRNNEM